MIDWSAQQASTPNGIEESKKAVGYKYYWGSDASQQFHSFVLDKESRGMTAIHTPIGLLQHTRLPFGLLVAPAIAQNAYRLMIAELDQEASGKQGVGMRARLSNFRMT